MSCKNCQLYKNIIKDLLTEVTKLKFELKMTNQGLNQEQRDFYDELLMKLPDLVISSGGKLS